MSTSTKQTGTPAPHRAVSVSLADRSHVEPVRIDRPHAASDVDARATNEPNSGDGTETRVLLTVLMPCLNESRTLATCIAEAHQACRAAGLRDALAVKAKKLAANAKKPIAHEDQSSESGGATPNEPPAAYEILIADNGSTDDSVAVAEAAGARVVQVEEKGYGAALRGGIVAARGKYVVMADSDCSYNFGDIPRFLAKLEEGFDLVVGNRFAGGIEPGAMPWHHRRIGNPVLSGLGRLLYRTPIRDWHCGLRAFDRQKVLGLGLQCSGMEFASEMILRASQARLAMAELPTTLRPDGRDRRPHLRSIRDGLRHVAVIIPIRHGVANSSKERSFHLLGEDSMARQHPLHNGLYLAIYGAILIAVGIGMIRSRESTKRTTKVHEPPQHRTISHDFGVVHSRASLSHKFAIVNDSDFPWTVKQLKTSCNCTVGSMDRSVIRPGEAAELDVQYRAPTVEGNDQRRVILTFYEANAPTFILEVRSRVRLIMDAEPRSIQIHGVPSTGFASRRVIVRNFGSTDWDDIRSEGTPEWLSLAVEKLDRSGSSSNCRQVWAVDLRIDGAQLEAMTLNATSLVSQTCQLIACDADGRSIAECDIQVRASPYVAIRVIPRFARLTRSPDGTYGTRLSIQFPPDRGVPSESTPLLEHDLGSSLQAEWYRVADHHWNLLLTLPSNVDGTHGTLRLGPRSDEMIDVPVEVITTNTAHDTSHSSPE